MNLPFTAFQIRLSLSRQVGDRLKVADEDTYGRFVSAVEFTEQTLTRFLVADTRGLRPTPFYAGILLDIRFDLPSEQFYIADFFDIDGDSPPTRPGASSVLPSRQALFELLVGAGLYPDYVLSIVSDANSSEQSLGSIAAEIFEGNNCNYPSFFIDDDDLVAVMDENEILSEFRYEYKTKTAAEYCGDDEINCDKSGKDVCDLSDVANKSRHLHDPQIRLDPMNESKSAVSHPSTTKIVYSTTDGRQRFPDILQVTYGDKAVIGFDRYGRALGAVVPVEAVRMLAGFSDNVDDDVRQRIQRAATALLAQLPSEQGNFDPPPEFTTLAEVDGARRQRQPSALPKLKKGGARKTSAA